MYFFVRLGAPHDEEHGHDHGGYETKRCSKAEGFIMSYNRYNENRILFSSCSKEAIVFTLRYTDNFTSFSFSSNQ